MDIKSVLKELTALAAVSGRENEAFEASKKYLSGCGRVYTDKLNSVICEIDGTTDGHILLDAHLDRIGLIVTSITEDGFIRVAACGGVDRRTLNGQEVTVHGKSALFGVIASVPPHLQSGENDRKAIEIDNVLIDIGMSKSEAEKYVSLGDRITINSEFSELLGDFVSCGALDDRAGVCVLLRVLELIKDKPHKRVTAVFSAQEETGESGAKAAAFNCDADEFIAVDVSFAKTPDSEEQKCGKIENGPMIGVAPSLSYEMSEELKKTAEKNAIPYQLEVMSGQTGTNADSITVARGGIKAGLISIPQKYMHTGVEVVSIKDIENCARLIAAYILGGAL